MAEMNEQVARLKELLRKAKVNGLAKTQKDFADFIGLKYKTVCDAMIGGSCLDNTIFAAEEALERAGVHVRNADPIEQRLTLIEQRLDRMEKALKLDDVTL